MPLPANMKIKQQLPQSDQPLWEGPAGNGPNGGVSFSLLSRYLVCKERFRILTMEGLKPREGFNSRLEFGSMWHICEDATGRGIDPFYQEAVYPGASEHTWGELLAYCKDLADRYRLDQEQINHWYEVTKALFPVYQEYWTEINPDKRKREPLEREQVFDLLYTLPSGRQVRLRGKRDGSDLVDGKAVELLENKTKSQIDVDKITRQLKFDLQTMLYVIVLQEEQIKMANTTMIAHRDDYRWKLGRNPIVGVRYNVVRRSAHKSIESMMKKVNDDYKAGRIGEWFSRWEVPVYEPDYKTFKEQCFHPILENLIDDYEWWNFCIWRGEGRRPGIDDEDPFNYVLREEQFPRHQSRHFRFPYGVYHPISEGGFDDVDEYMATGSLVGLERPSTLFPELES